MQIDEYIKINNSQRPQSAMSQSTRPGSSMVKATEASMRSSFYSNSETKEVVEVPENKIVECFKLSNVLELNQREKQIINEIKNIMEEECQKLASDIDDI